MRKASIAIAVAAALAVAGCGGSPEKTFASLKDAAAARDAQAIWDNLTPETQGELSLMAADAGVSGSAPDAAGLAYLKVLTRQLGATEIDVIKSMRVGDVRITGTAARMSLGSFRGSVDKTLVFRKVGGKWKWDARDILRWYLENRSSLGLYGGIANDQTAV